VEGMNMRETYQAEMNVCVCGKEVNSTFQFNPLFSKFTLSEGVVRWGSSGNGLSGLWSEGGTKRREGDAEMKEVLKEGRERREPQAVRSLRERYIMYV